MIDIQSALTFTAVAAAAAYIAKEIHHQFAPLRKGNEDEETKCGGCTGCSGPSKSEEPKLITLSIKQPRRPSN